MRGIAYYTLKKMITTLKHISVETTQNEAIEKAKY